MRSHHQVAEEDVRHRDEKRRRPPSGLRDAVASQHLVDREPEQQREDHRSEADADGGVLEQGERRQQNVEPPPQVRSLVADDRPGRPWERRIEDRSLDVCRGMADVIEAVEVRHLRKKRQVAERDDEEDRADGQRRGAAPHEIGFAFNHSPHHSIVEYRPWRSRHGVQPP